jgi:hypothetical protein
MPEFEFQLLVVPGTAFWMSQETFPATEPLAGATRGQGIMGAFSASLAARGDHVTQFLLMQCK